MLFRSVDAAAYNARAYDSFHYGLREARMVQELMLYARPQGTQFWQFTNDYALVRSRPDGTIEPTSRFWLMKHFTDLTPQKSDVLAAMSDQPAVLITAFRAGSKYAVHILNLGPAREAAVEGLPDGPWQITQTSETASFEKKPAPTPLHLQLPARALVTLTLE